MMMMMVMLMIAVSIVLQTLQKYPCRFTITLWPVLDEDTHCTRTIVKRICTQYSNVCMVSNKRQIVVKDIV